MSARAELVGRGVGALRRSTLWWGVSIAVFTGINVAFWPSLEGSAALEELDRMSEDLLRAFGAQGLATPSGYLDGQLFALMLPLLLSGAAVAGVSAITSGDEDAGRLELLHVLPVSRRAIWLARLAAGLLALAALAVTTAVLVGIAVPLLSFDGVAIHRVVLATVACTLLAAFHAFLTFALGATGFSRGRCVGLTVAVLVGGYVMNFVVPIAEQLRWMRRASPWWWAIGEQPVTNGVGAAGLGLLVLSSAALVLVGVIRLERRDIRCA